MERAMSIAEKYLKEQMKSGEFRRAYLEEKTRLDIEYRLEELKRDIQKHKSPDELIEKVEDLEKFVMGV
jgi:hypothetical protein